MTATIVEGNELLQTVAASLLAGVGVTFVFSIAIWGVARFVDLSRNERPLAAGAAAVVTGCALLVTGGAVVVGIIAMTNK
jgi:hypothetical protein